MLIGLETSRKLGLVAFNLVVQMDDPDVAASGKVWKRPNSKKAAELPPKQNLNTCLQVLKEFPDVFDEIGCLPREYIINIDPKVPPVVYPPQRVLVSLRDKFKAELDSREKKGIILPNTKPTLGINSFVPPRWTDQLGYA